MTRLTRLGLVFAVLAGGVFTAFQATRQNVSSGHKPVITIDNKDRQVSVKDTEQELCKGVHANDREDGDVSSSLVVEQISNFVDNKRRITYAAFDHDNNVATASSEISYTDYSHPQIELTAPLSFPVGETSFLDDVTAKDCLDGDISAEVDIRSEKSINTSKAGLYPVQLSVSNSAGDTSVLPATLELYDAGNGPAIALTQYTLYLEKGEAFQPEHYIKSVLANGQRITAKDGIRIDAINPVEGDGLIDDDDEEKADSTESVTSDASGTAIQNLVGGESSEEGGDTDSSDEDIDLPETDGGVTIDNPVNTEKTGTYQVSYYLTGRNAQRGATRMLVVVSDLPVMK